jgi:hypothetical protein
MRKNTPDIVFEAVVENIDVTSKQLAEIPILRRRSTSIGTISALRTYAVDLINAVEGRPRTSGPDALPAQVNTLMAENPDLSVDDLMRRLSPRHPNRKTIAALYWRARRILNLWGQHASDYRLAIRARDRSMELYAMLKAIMAKTEQTLPDELRFEGARLLSRIER